jgi:hypothetical protein
MVAGTLSLYNKSIGVSSGSLLLTVIPAVLTLPVVDGVNVTTKSVTLVDCPFNRYGKVVFDTAVEENPIPESAVTETVDVIVKLVYPKEYI